MSLPRYPEYKDSGVAWLEETPSHWRIARYKEIFFERDERSVEGKETLLSVSAYTGVSPRSEIIGDGDHLSRAESLEGYKVCYPDDLVMNIMLAWNRGLGFSAYHGIVSPAYCVFKPHREVNPRFLDYLVRDNRTNLYFKAFSSGVIDSRLRLYPEVFGSLYCGLPSQEEQTAIATFLDRETAKIDGLIAEQEKLIALLAEKCQATISHAVTKGLNPDAPMKDSGVAWLGEVPAHWEAANLKRFAEVIDCKHHTVEFLDEGLPIVSIRELRNNRIDMSNAKLTSQVEWDFLREGRAPEYGDLVFCRNASVGAVAYVDVTEQPFCMGQDVCLIRPLTKSKFMHYQLTAPEITNQIESFLVGATIRRANVEEIRNLFVTWPAEEEQAAIATFLDSEINRLDALTAEATHGIALLKERRSAVISAAVTGKIDVRHLAKQKAA